VSECTSLLYFVVRVRCRRTESSRSLSHLLMSFLFYVGYILIHRLYANFYCATYCRILQTTVLTIAILSIRRSVTCVTGIGLSYVVRYWSYIDPHRSYPCGVETATVTARGARPSYFRLCNKFSFGNGQATHKRHT